METTANNVAEVHEETTKLSTDALLDALKDTEKTDAEKIKLGFSSESKPVTNVVSSLTVPSGIDRIIAQEAEKRNSESATRDEESVKHALREHYSDVQRGQFESGYGKGSRRQNKRKGKKKVKGAAYQEKMTMKASRQRKGRQSRHSMY